MRLIEGLDANDPRRAPLEEALSRWIPGADFHLDPIPGGFSDSGVFRLDVRKPPKDTLNSGIYILKISPISDHDGQSSEYKAHETAYERSPEFAKIHIPRLLLTFRSEQNPNFYVMLFDVAGRSLSRYTASVGEHASLIFDSADGIISDIASAWADSEFHPRSSVYDVLTTACGYRHDYTKAHFLHDFINSTCDGDLFILAGNLLVNPLHFLTVLSQRKEHSVSALYGLIHGDLHAGNILFHRFGPSAKPYYIIDFALSEKNLIGYDLAYLELSYALSFLGSAGPAPLMAVLHALDPDMDHGVVPPSAMWVEALFRKLRYSLEQWLSERFPRRQDDFEKQILLARVAAGINWANKPLDRSWKVAAVAYAGWAARRYLEIYLSDEWTRLSRFEVEKSKSDLSSDALWHQLFHEAGRFDQSQGVFVLVTEGQKGSAELAALGNLPWSVVIDLDPNSDEHGVHRYCSTVLASKRSLHLFTSHIPECDPRRSTAWMLAAGWSIKREFFPDFFQWRWNRLPIIRDLVRRLSERTNPTPVFCLILPGLTLDRDSPSSRLSSIIKDIDEATRGRAKIFVLGNRPIDESATNLVTVPLAVADLVRNLSNTFGTTAKTEGVKIPGPAGEWRSIRSEKLRSLEEDLTILHSDVTVSASAGTEKKLATEFWRGRPPTWEEVAAGIDIERDIIEELCGECRKWLASHRSHTIVVEHQPGAGGTTAAMRVAWNLHDEHPTAYIDSFSSGLGERIRELFLLSEQPVLLIADSSVLTESNREEVQRYLAMNNCRAVLLYLRRSFFPSKKRAQVVVADLSPREVKEFKSVFSSMTTEVRRQKQIAKISSQDTLKKYRLPFFYGLIVFERDFLGIEDYIERHLTGVSRNVRRVLEHIALVTIFSNGSIPESTIYSLSGVGPESSLEVRDLFGDGAANLLVSYSGGVRMMHQILAEEVLEHFRSGIQDDWRLDLKSYSIDFISDLVEAAGPISCVELFRKLFIDRAGSIDGVEDREDFSPIIETLDSIEFSLGHAVLEDLCQHCPEESHFWSHLGRHQVYRMQRDYEKAAEYLHRAIALNSESAVHYHTLGLVLRSRLRHDLRALPRTSSLAAVFSALDPLFSEAENAFQDTRRLSPDNVYGYITNIQLITAAISRLKSAAAVDSVALIAADNTAISLWLEEKLAEAEELLRGAANLYSALEPTNQFLVTCEAELDRLYGDLDGVVERWELANASGRGANTRSRSALANAYLARAGRKWRNLAVSEKRRIAELASTNLRDTGRRSDDYALWFHSFSSIPEFDFDEAISQITLWSRRFPSWEAHYYLYILYFLLWFGQRTNDLDNYREHLRRCQELSFARKSRSPVWFGRSVSECRVVSELDLGSWDRNSNFFESAESLERVNGIIDKIDGPTSGAIVIDGKLSIFFSPGRDYAQYRSINERVNFFLGFSPTGPRAWRIESGFVEGGNRARSTVVAEGSVLVEHADAGSSKEIQMENIKQLNFGRLLKFATEFTQAKARLGARIELEGLLERLGSLHRTDVGTNEAFDVGALLEGLGGYGIANYEDPDGRVILKPSLKDGEEVYDVPRTVSEEQRMGQVTNVPEGKRYGFIAAHGADRYFFHFSAVLPAFRGEIGNGQIVSFIPATGERGPIAQGVTVHDKVVLASNGQIREDELPESVCDFVLKYIGDAEHSSVELRYVVDAVKAEFLASRPLEEILESKSIGAFINAIEGVAVFGRPPDLMVGRSDEPFLGRVPLDDFANESKAGRAKLESADFEAWLRGVLSSEASETEGVSLASVGVRAKKHFDVEGKIPQALGFASYGKLLSALEGFRIEGTGPHQRVFLAEAERSRKTSASKSEKAVLNLSNFKAWLADLLASEPAASEGMLFSTLGDRAKAHFDVDGKVPQALGFASYAKLLSSLGGFRIEGTGHHQRVFAD